MEFQEIRVQIDHLLVISVYATSHFVPEETETAFSHNHVARKCQSWVLDLLLIPESPYVFFSCDKLSVPQKKYMTYDIHF